MIKELRKEIGLTQAELAEKLNISQSAVTHWETGKRFPSPPNARAFVNLMCGYGQRITLDDIYRNVTMPAEISREAA